MKLTKWFAGLALLWACLLSACDAPSRNIEVKAFTASWCTPCKQQHATLTKVAELVDVTVIDVDEHRTYARTHDVHSVPAYLIYRDGELIGRTDNADALLRQCRKLQAN